ncbi:MAG: hypothetical protein ACFFCS_09605 [Candidatus Hodarchaeota archaeon]
MLDLIEYNDEGMFTKVYTFEHPSKPAKVRLIPVVHIGEPSYYSALLDMIGDQPCLYEFVTGADTSASDLFKTFVYEEDFDEIVRVTKNHEYFKRNRAIFKRFMKKHAPLELKILHGQLKTLFWAFTESTLDEIFKVANFSLFDIGTLILLQRFLADYLQVSFQLKEIDYYGDIMKRDNWHHADIKLDDVKEDDKEPVELTPGVISYFTDQVKTVLVSLASYYKLLKIPTIKERRINFAKLVDNIDNLTREMIDDSIPDLMMEVRNEVVIEQIEKMIDKGSTFFVFYGMLHLRSIEEFLTSKGYVAKEKEFVKVFSF